MTPAAGAGVVALLELDAASVGPFLLSRPFVIGPLVGALRGDAWTGAALGVAFEALTLAELPLGGCLDLSAPVAAGTAAWLASGAGALAPEAAFASGLVAGWAHARLERVLRRSRGAHVRRAEAALAAGAPSRLGAELFGALTGQAAVTFAFSLAVLGVVGPLIARVWPAVPGLARAGARAAFLAAPWIGGGSLAAALWRRA